MASTKIAISLPASTFAKLEKRRRELKRSRSAAIAEAIEAWLGREQLNDEERRYIAGYLAHPDNEQQRGAIVSVSAWGDWDEA